MDKRVKKTHRELKNAMFCLLEEQSFGGITVCDLCEKAFISRSTFYSNFKDKYGLLEYCFEDIRKNFELYVSDHTEKQVIEKLNEFLCDNAKILANLADQSNVELMNLLQTLLSPNLSKNLSIIEQEGNKMTDSHLALFHFCAGGMANLLIWQIKNNFPIDKKVMTEYLYHLQKGIAKWDLDRLIIS